MRVSCPHCQGECTNTADTAGKEIFCPHCGNKVQMPALPAQPIQSDSSPQPGNPTNVDVTHRERGALRRGFFEETGRGLSRAFAAMIGGAGRGVVRLVFYVLVLIGCVGAAIAIVLLLAD